MEVEKIGSFIDEKVVEKKATNKNERNEKIVFVKETDKEELFRFVDSFVDSKDTSLNDSSISDGSMKICFK